MRLREIWEKEVPNDLYWDLWWCRNGPLITFVMGTAFGLYIGLLF
jgi:hypothetical protein